jgi:hypothetical protein
MRRIPLAAYMPVLPGIVWRERPEPNLPGMTRMSLAAGRSPSRRLSDRDALRCCATASTREGLCCWI